MIQPPSMAPSGCLWGPDRGGVRTTRWWGRCCEGPGRAFKPTCNALLSPISIYQLLRKRHIGNDIVTIIFQEPGALPFTPKNIRSHFQHVFIIIRAHNPCTDNVCYRYAPPHGLRGAARGWPPSPAPSPAPTGSHSSGFPSPGSMQRDSQQLAACVCFTSPLPTCPHIPTPSRERSSVKKGYGTPVLIRRPLGIHICLESFGCK